MAYEFKKLAEAEAAEAVGEGANVFIEEGGEIKRVPKAAVGGSAGAGGALTVIIKNAAYEKVLTGETPTEDEMRYFDASVPHAEVLAALKACKPVTALVFQGVFNEYSDPNTYTTAWTPKSFNMHNLLDEPEGTIEISGDAFLIWHPSDDRIDADYSPSADEE